MTYLSTEEKNICTLTDNLPTTYKEEEQINKMGKEQKNSTEFPYDF